MAPLFDLEEAKRYIGGQVPHLVRRFPLEQGEDKVRSIDDYLEASLNFLYSADEKLVLLDTDTLAAVVRLLERILSDEVTEIVFSSTGATKKISIHKDWGKTREHLSQWLGRTKDLKHAYKQLAVKFSGVWASTIVVYDPSSSRPAIFVQHSLPFGSSSSVMSFNRWARFIWHVATREFGLIWTNFFDDYLILAPSILCESIDVSIKVLINSLGWKISEGGSKDANWAPTFTPLGVLLDVSRLAAKGSTVANKPKRIESVSAKLEKFISDGWASTRDVESASGQVQYMEAQVFGRASRGAVGALSRTRGQGKKFTTSDIANLKWLVEWMRHAVPRPISPKFVGPPLILFTDGACEDFDDTANAKITMGAVLLDRRDMVALVFGAAVNPTLVMEWRRLCPGKKQFVTEAEILPVLVAAVNWRRRMAGAKTLVFIDSNPAKFALIKGSSDSPACECIVRSIMFEDAEHVSYPWFSRVPSKSNLADDPSRLVFPVRILTFKVEVCEVLQPDSLLNGVWPVLERGEM